MARMNKVDVKQENSRFQCHLKELFEKSQKELKGEEKGHWYDKYVEL